MTDNSIKGFRIRQSRSIPPDKSEEDAPVFSTYIFCAAPPSRGSGSPVEVGRGIRWARGLVRPYTPHSVSGTFDRTTGVKFFPAVSKVILGSITIRSRCPPKIA